MPTKKQFDYLALSWLQDVPTVNDVHITPEILKRTYRLTFDHCDAGACKRACSANPRCLVGLTGADLVDRLEKSLATESASTGSRTNFPAGLRNLGATCYLNSLLQVWFHDEGMREIILKWDRSIDSGEVNASRDVPQTIVGHLQLIFAKLLKSPKMSVDPSAFVEFLGLDFEYQQDPSEFADLLFFRVVDQLRGYPDSSLATHLERMFRGERNHVIECSSCGEPRRSKDVFFHLSLNIVGARSIGQCLRALGQKKKVEGGAFCCGSCLSTEGVTTYEELVALPPSLSIQLQRYKFNVKLGTRKKINAAVRFPALLDMAPFTTRESVAQLYDLKAVLVHVGQAATSGHYIANVKVPTVVTDYQGAPRWFRFNDELVSMPKDPTDFGNEDDSDEDESHNVNTHATSSNGCRNEFSDQGETASMNMCTPISVDLGGEQDHQLIINNGGFSLKPSALVSSTAEIVSALVSPSELAVGSSTEDNGARGSLSSSCAEALENTNIFKSSQSRRFTGEKGADTSPKKKQKRLRTNHKKDSRDHFLPDDSSIRKSSASDGNADSFSSRGAYLLVYEKRTDREANGSQDKSSITYKEERLHPYLQDIIDAEAAEFELQDAEAAAVRKKCTARLHELKNDLLRITSCLSYKPLLCGAQMPSKNKLANERFQPRFVQTAYLLDWIKETRKEIIRLSKEKSKDANSGAVDLNEIQPLKRSAATYCSQTVENLHGISSTQTLPRTELEEANSEEEAAQNSTRSIRCPHGRLAPDASGLKVITEEGAMLLEKFCLTYRLLSTELIELQRAIPQELCYQCVSRVAQRIFFEKRILNDRKSLVKLLRAKDQPTFWIGNRSFILWVKMAYHQFARLVNHADFEKEDDKASFEFNKDLLCHHGALSIRGRRKIPKSAWELIKEYFDVCPEFSTEEPDCSLCRQENEAAQAVQAELVDTANSLRLQLPRLMKMCKAFPANAADTHEDVNAFLLHSLQADAIRRSLKNPRCKRPGGLKNALLCKHNATLLTTSQLAHEPSCFSDQAVILTKKEWELILSEFDISGSVKLHARWNPAKQEYETAIEPDLCVSCIEEERIAAQQASCTFKNARLVVQLLPLEELLCHASVISTESLPPSPRTGADPVSTDAQTLTSTKALGAVETHKPETLRRRRRVCGNRVVEINSDDKFVDLKIKLMEKFGISPLLQVICVDGKLVEVEGETLLRDIGIKSSSEVYLAERCEKTDSKAEYNIIETGHKKRLKTEHGFSGTKLLG